MIYSPNMGIAILGNVIDPFTIAEIKKRIPEDALSGLRVVVSCLTDGIGLAEQMEDVGEVMDLYGKSRRAGISIAELSKYVDKLTGTVPKEKAGGKTLGELLPVTPKFTFPTNQLGKSSLPNPNSVQQVKKVKPIAQAGHPMEQLAAKEEYKRLKTLKYSYAKIAKRLANKFPHLKELDAESCKTEFN